MAGWGARARRVWLEKAPFVAISGGASLGALMALGKGIIPIDQVSAMDRAAISVYSLAFYLWKMVVPVNLSPLYGLPARIEPLSQAEQEADVRDAADTLANKIASAQANNNVRYVIVAKLAESFGTPDLKRQLRDDYNDELKGQLDYCLAKKTWPQLFTTSAAHKPPIACSKFFPSNPSQVVPPARGGSKRGPPAR